MGVHKHRKSRLSPMVLRQMNPNPCEHCGGEGKVWDFSANEVEPCPKCKSPIQQEKTPLEVVMEHDCDDANLVPEPTQEQMSVPEHIDYLLSGYEEGFATHSEIREYIEDYISRRVKEGKIEELQILLKLGLVLDSPNMIAHANSRIKELERED